MSTNNYYRVRVTGELYFFDERDPEDERRVFTTAYRRMDEHGGSVRRGDLRVYHQTTLSRAHLVMAIGEVPPAVVEGVRT